MRRLPHALQALGSIVVAACVTAGGPAAWRLYPVRAASDVLGHALDVVARARGAVVELQARDSGHGGVVRAVVPWSDEGVRLYDVTVTISEEAKNTRVQIVADVKRPTSDELLPAPTSRKPCNCPTDDLQRVEVRARSNSAELRSARLLSQTLLRALDERLR